MEWFVIVVFAVFIGGLVWVSVEAIRHAEKHPSPKKTNSSDARSSAVDLQSSQATLYSNKLNTDVIQKINNVQNVLRARRVVC